MTRFGLTVLLAFYGAILLVASPVSAVPAPTIIKRADPIPNPFPPGCNPTAKLAILPVNDTDPTLLGIAQVIDETPERDYTYELTLVLPDEAVDIASDGTLTFVGGLGPNKAAGFTVKATMVDPPFVEREQFFLVQMV
ncbi:hypothetical protein BC832DRAFT_592616 [Gaertneriomyces semiglobifer]|nr:hypothetical protein BC832DRAFT_592616 [Gaertneriomyces semiglobifer]